MESIVRRKGLYLPGFLTPIRTGLEVNMNLSFSSSITVLAMFKILSFLVRCIPVAIMFADIHQENMSVQ